MVPVEMLGPRSFRGVRNISVNATNFSDYRFFNKRLNSVNSAGQNSFIRAPSSGAYN